MSPVPPTVVGRLVPPTGLRFVCRYSVFHRRTRLFAGYQLAPRRRSQGFQCSPEISDRPAQA